MNDQTYNGWTNHATWRVNLEVFDGLNLRDHFDELPDTYTVIQWAREYAESLLDEGANELARDWALAFLSEVDWHSIARHLIENASEVDA